MRLIKPSEISGKIMTLIEDSHSQVILVSPYIKISEWKKFLNKLMDAKKRNVEILFYIRKDKTTSSTYKDLYSLGFNFKPIPNLHCKFYLNESVA